MKLLRILPLCGLLVLSSFGMASAQKGKGSSKPPAKGASKYDPNTTVTKVANPKKHNPTDTVAIVNGTVITYYDFRSVMTDYLRIFAKRAKDNIITDAMYTQIVDSTWDKMTGDILVQQEIAKRGLGLSDEAAITLIADNPPDFLAQQFRDSLGVVHKDYIAKALADPRNDTVSRIIIAAAKIQMEQEKLEASIAPSCKTPEERAKAFDAWLRKTRDHAKIEDRRLSFGFY